jgi:two-component system repressor protein LuxO
MLPAPVVRPGAVAAPPGTAGTVPAELAMAAEPEKLAWLAAPPPAILPATPPPEPAPPFAVSHAAMPVEAAPGMAPVMPAATPVEMEVMPLAEMERRLVVAALRRTANDVPRAAALLQINPSTIYRKLTIWRAEGRIADM